MPVLERPAYLACFLLLPALAIALRLLPKPAESRFPFSLPGQALPGSAFHAFLSFASRSLFWIALACLCLAASGPALVRRDLLYLDRGRDVVFVLDASPSMSARDFGTSRFDVCRGILRDFATSGGNASLGLVAFGNEAVLAVPPTEDRQFFLDRLSTLAPGAYGEGTAIGMGIATAVFHLRSSQAPSRLIVVFTDGENNSGAISPIRAAELASDAQIPLVLIGIGSRGEVLVTWTDPKTGKEMEGRYSSDFDEASLARIAERSGGSFMAARDAQAMKKVKAQVIRASAALGRTRESRHASSLVPALLGIALAALALGIALECLAGEASACP